MAIRFRPGTRPPPRQSTVRLSRAQLEAIEDAIGKSPAAAIVAAIEDALFTYGENRSDPRTGSLLRQGRRRITDAIRSAQRIIDALSIVEKSVEALARRQAESRRDDSLRDDLMKAVNRWRRYLLEIER